MTRLIDADALCEEFKRRHKAALRWKEEAILADNEESKIRADAILTFLSEVKLTIDNAPTVEQPTGEWEIVDAEGGKIWNCVCTECGHDPQEYINGSENWWLTKYLPKFCPNCGVRIVNVKGGKKE